MHLSAINRYPLKSGHAESLAVADLQPWGLVGDRRWMVVDADGETVTAREHPHLILVRAEIVDDGLRLSGPGADDLLVQTPADGHLDVSIFGRAPFAVRAATEDAHEWVSAILGMPCRLVYQDDPTVRPTNPRFTKPSDRVSLADGYPVLVACEASLASLNDWIAEGRHGAEWPIPMIRFRPNLVVSGSRAWEEDGWRRLRIGSITFRAVKGSDRCVLTTVDPDTAQMGREPLATLVKHRRWDGQSWFGVNLVPDLDSESSTGQHATLSVGDEVEVLVAATDVDGPLR